MRIVGQFMATKTSFRIVSVLVCTIALGACALNNEILIESNEDPRSEFFINGFELRFPSKANVHIVPLQGASWQIGGDISGIIRDVVSDISAIDFEGLASQHGSYMDIQDIKIVHQDSTPGGATSLISVGLNLQFVGKYNGIYIDNCQLARIIPERPPPIHHGLFASRDKMRSMIQPVYESLIKEALKEALVTGLNCLARESEKALKN